MPSRTTKSSTNKKVRMPTCEGSWHTGFTQNNIDDWGGHSFRNKIPLKETFITYDGYEFPCRQCKLTKLIFKLAIGAEHRRLTENY